MCSCTTYYCHNAIKWSNSSNVAYFACIQLLCGEHIQIETDDHGLLLCFVYIVDERPTEKDLNQFLTTYAPYWKSIADLLGLNQAVIRVTEMNEHYRPRECFREILSKWLKQDLNATWRKLELCITNAQRSEHGFKKLDFSKCQYNVKNCMHTNICRYIVLLYPFCSAKSVQASTPKSAGCQSNW